MTVGQLYVVIDPCVFRLLGDFESDAHQIVRFVKAARTLPGAQVLIAGEREASIARTRRESGIPASAAVRAQLDRLGRELSVGSLRAVAPTPR